MLTPATTYAKSIPIDGVVDMHRRFPILQSKADDCIQTVFQGLYGRMLLNDPLSILVDDALCKVR